MTLCSVTFLTVVAVSAVLQASSPQVQHHFQLSSLFAAAHCDSRCSGISSLLALPLSCRTVHNGQNHCHIELAKQISDVSPAAAPTPKVQLLLHFSVWIFTSIASSYRIVQRRLTASNNSLLQCYYTSTAKRFILLVDDILSKR